MMIVFRRQRSVRIEFEGNPEKVENESEYMKTCAMTGFARALALLLFILMGAVACTHGTPAPQEEGKKALALSSTAFRDGETIPAKYTCQGQDMSPPLMWSEPSDGNQAFAVIMDDPDAPGGAFTHWVLFNLARDSRELPEAIPPKEQLTGGALQGRNDFGRICYAGPCPPPGPAHRYRFTIYALDQPLTLGSGASKQMVLDAMQGHIVAKGQLTGTYGR